MDRQPPCHIVPNPPDRHSHHRHPAGRLRTLPSTRDATDLCSTGEQPPRDGGQAAPIEFALTSMVTLLLIFALIDFSRAIYTASVVQWAATYGARFGVNDPEDLSGIEGEVKSAWWGWRPTRPRSP
ncbi:MAG: pilus assembly protein [Sandaracinaceae bacterium]|nr:pilus assembly protein [Sandaracinaceae bacterium]